MEKGKKTVAYGEIIAQCWADESYKKEFILDPEVKLTEAGIAVEEGVTYQVIEAPKMIQYIVLPYENTKSAVQELAKMLLNRSEKKSEIIPPNVEIRIIQDSADIRYLILPASPKTLTAAELSMVTGGGATATTTVAQAEVVAQIVEVQTVTTTTTTIAEAAAVVVVAAACVLI